MTLRHMLPSRRFLQVWRRHFLVWRKTTLASLMGSFGEPLLYLTGMGFGLGRFVGEIDGMSYLVFLGAGILAASSMNTATFEALYGAFTRMTRQNTFHAMLATPLTVADVVAGEVTWAATKALISGTAIFLVGSAMGAFPAASAPLALPVVLLSGLTFACLGMVATAISPSYEFFLYYFTLITTPMFLFCGVFYPLAGLPEGVQGLLQLLPMAHVIALVRPLTTGLPLTAPLLHLGALLLYAATGFLLATRLVRRRIIV